MRKLYYRIKLTLWALWYLPKRVYVADTDISIAAHNWAFAIPARIDTSEMKFFGASRKFARYYYEPREYHHFLDLLRGKKVFFDVGCNIGWYSYVAAANGIKEIVAFDFMREYAEYARSNFAYNGIQAKVVNRGVGKSGSTSNYGDPLSDASGELISLDDYAEKNRIWPDVMKMDIEGYELDALLGASSILARRPALNISVHDGFLRGRGQSPDEVLKVIYEYGYELVFQYQDSYFFR